MDKKTKTLIFLSILLLLIVAGLIFVVFDSKKNNLQNTNKELPTHYSYFSNKYFFEEAFEQGNGQIKKTDTKIYGGILPHHLIVKDKIAAFFEGIKKYNYKTIILIGPNHLSGGNKKIVTSKARWKTPYGYLEPNLSLINKLENLSVVDAEESLFDNEYSISGLVSFIKKVFPEAEFVPLILKTNVSPEESLDLARAIFDGVNTKETLVLASVDFSHYQPVSVADFHDLKSNSVIQSFDFDRIYSSEVDSPPSIYTLLKYLELSGAQKSDLIFSTNSGALIGNNDVSTTSHNFFYFEKGQKSEEKLINLLFFGDLMLDRNVGKIIAEKGLDYIFSDLSGEENKFFEGVDMISANLEGTVTNDGMHYKPDFSYDFSFNPDLINQLKKYNFNFFNLANNHFTDQGERGVTETKENLNKLKINYSGCPDGEINECNSSIVQIADKKIGMFGFSMTYSTVNEEEIKKSVQELKNLSDLVIVNIHWGTEYSHEFSVTQQKMAHSLIDAGADVIIGHHPHVVQGMEIYKEKPIFYSLGNFVFDQYFSQDTQEGLAVGLTIGESIDFFLYPIKSDLSRPKLMQGAEKELFLNKLDSWSK